MASDSSFSLTYVALIVGGLLVVAARLPECTSRPLAKDRRWEERMYWCSSLVGSVLATTAMIPRSVPGAVAIGFVTLWSTFLYRPGGPNQRRRWERQQCRHAPDVEAGRHGVKEAAASERISPAWLTAMK